MAKKIAVLCIVALLVAGSLSAQSLKGMSLNGVTGLYTIPTARIGWERSADFGLDFGYHTVIDEKMNHLLSVNASLLKWFELTGTFDIQPERYKYKGEQPNDLLFGAKVQLPVQKTAMAIGGNLQFINPNDEINARSFVAGQIYLAVTYAGDFFNMPAETTAVVGKTFLEDDPNNSNIDFGMGFDLVLLPDVFQRYVHWIVDFANFSYSVDPWGADAYWRAILNTGVRIDLSVIPALSQFKFAIDVLGTDLFDESRAFSIGAVFGFAIK